MVYLKIALPFLVLVGALLAQPVYAHGFGERYVLPLGFFAMGGAAAVVLSFVMVGTVVKGEARSFRYPRFNLFRYGWVESLLTGPALVPIKLTVVFLFLLLLATGFAGSPRPVANFTPTFVWVIWWVGLGFLVALLGNLWALVNPWKIIFGWAEGLYGRFRPDRELDLSYTYPQHWGIWPAALLFFAFAWIENAYIESADPRFLAQAVVMYSLVTWGGMLVFGKHQWLRRGEVFSVVFGILARFSIFEVRVPDGGACRECSSGGECRNEDGDCIDCYECFEYADERQLNLRPPAVGLDNPVPVNPSAVAVVMFLLALVTFDGFSATREWLYVQSFFITQFPTLNYAWLNGVTIANTLGLVGFPLAFVAIYWAFCNLMHLAVGRKPPVPPVLMGAFVFSLIPIALAYHYAHFIGYLLIQGQLIIPLVSDPFGYGWDLFGTAAYLIEVGVIGPRFVWFFSVGAIVLGHIIAVYLAHLRALRIYGDPAVAMRSQIPMLGLMVVYTVASLWVVTRPITQ